MEPGVGARVRQETGALKAEADMKWDGEAGACYNVRTGPVRGHGGWGGRWHLPRAVVGGMEHSTSFHFHDWGPGQAPPGLVMGMN